MTRLARSRVVIKDLIFASPACCIQWWVVIFVISCLSFEDQMKVKVVLTYLFFSTGEFLALANDAASSYLGRSTRRTAGPGHIWSQSWASCSSHTSKHSAALEGISCENWLNLPTLGEATFLLNKQTFSTGMGISSQNILLLRHLLSFCLSQNL